MCFIQEVLNRCIRLGSYDDFVELIQEDLSPVIPPEPTVQFKYSSTAECELNECWGVDASSVCPPPPAPIPESQVAEKLIESIRAKKDIQELREVIDSLPSVNPELSLDRNSETAIRVCGV